MGLRPAFSYYRQAGCQEMRDNKNITQNITLLFISISAVIAISVVGDFVNTLSVMYLKAQNYKALQTGK